MALVPALCDIVYPEPPFALTRGLDTSNGYSVLNASGQRVAHVVKIPRAGNLAKVHFRTGTVTTGDTVKVSLQDLSTSTGYPDGTADQYRTISIADGDDASLLVTGLLTSDGTDGGSKRAVLPGDVLAVVFEWDSYVAGNLQIQTLYHTHTRVGDLWGNSVYRYASGAWSQPDSQQSSMILLEYDDGVIVSGISSFAVENENYYSMHTGTTPDEVALKFTLPFGCKVAGGWCAYYNDGTSGQDPALVLYDSDGSTVLASATLDADLNWFGFPYWGYGLARFSSEIEITAGQAYRMAFKPSSGSPTTRLYYYESDLAAQITGLPTGAGAHVSTRADAGSWSDVATRQPLIGLLISALGDGA